MTVAVLVLTVLLAAANGANDVAKGVATLAGAGVTRYGTAIAWGAGTAGWVAVSTRARLPVSTTHALVGYLLGAGLLAAPRGVQWSSLLHKVAVPLLAGAVPPTSACRRVEGDATPALGVLWRGGSCPRPQRHPETRRRRRRVGVGG
ncbi:MAG: inorganic phosphate transporter [Haloechinothrix sp.]